MWNMCATTLTVENEAVIIALDFLTDDDAAGKRCLAMGATVLYRRYFAGSGAE